MGTAGAGPENVGPENVEPDNVPTMADRRWVDDVPAEHLLAVLAEHGTDVNALPRAPEPGPGADESDDASAFYQVVPLRDAWLRIGVDDRGRLDGHWIAHPARPEVVNDATPIIFEESEATDLTGWIRARADLDGSCRRWISVLRRPEREAYVALIYEAGQDGPVRRRTVAGIYPDITLCDEDAALVAFVEPDRHERGLTRAVLAPVGDDFETGRKVLQDSTAGGLGLRACSVRRFVKLSHGVRTLRVWDLIDVRASRPSPISVPGVPDDPDLFDVALLDGDVVLAQAVNLVGDALGGGREEHWELVVSVIEDGEILQSWRAATGKGTALEVTSGDGCALIRVRSAGPDQMMAEHVLRVTLAGFSTKGSVALQSTTGLFSLSVNTVTPSVGFSATELVGGSDPYSWYWDKDGRVLNPGVEIAERAASPLRASTERVVSPDGYEFLVDLRWRSVGDEPFAGPVLLMVYGAYGLDIDLDADRDLGRWLDRGIAVGTPHVRGGGRGPRHLAGCRGNRDRSLMDVQAAIRWLRSGQGLVTATKVCMLGASAGGFLAATTLNTCPDEVDACVIVNGYVDPLTSLLRRDTPTLASDQDEWGNPADNITDLEMLQAVSPVDNLESAGPARALVVVSGNDVRVNPRQGLKWCLTYRSLGGQATLWYDPKGAHDCWGNGMDPDAMVDWVCDALDVNQ